MNAFDSSQMISSNFAAAASATVSAAFSGRLVRLAAFDLERDPAVMARWNQDSEYQQLQSSMPAMLWPASQIKEWMEKHYNESYGFSIRTLAGDRLIGFLDLGGLDWTARNCWVGIGIGEREYWGKGYGSEAMNLALRFAFTSLNLKRVTLDVFEYNRRAYLSYCKCGFQEEGRLRQWMQRGGERFDLIFMGILRQEWEERQNRLQEQTVPGERMALTEPSGAQGPAQVEQT